MAHTHNRRGVVADKRDECGWQALIAANKAAQERGHRARSRGVGEGLIPSSRAPILEHETHRRQDEEGVEARARSRVTRLVIEIDHKTQQSRAQNHGRRARSLPPPGRTRTRLLVTRRSLCPQRGHQLHHRRRASVRRGTGQCNAPGKTRPPMAIRRIASTNGKGYIPIGHAKRTISAMAGISTVLMGLVVSS